MSKIRMNGGGLFRIILLGGAALFLAGCGSPLTPAAPDGTMRSTSEPAQAAGTDEAPASPTEIQMTPPAPTPSDAALQGLVEMARGDLAQRLSVPAAQINFVEATAVEWSDSSLGCPQPGMSYLQVIMPGYRILLETGGQEYAYHADRGTYVLYCENPIPPGLPKHKLSKYI